MKFETFEQVFAHRGGASFKCHELSDYVYISPVAPIGDNMEVGQILASGDLRHDKKKREMLQDAPDATFSKRNTQKVGHFSFAIWL